MKTKKTLTLLSLAAVAVLTLSFKLTNDDKITICHVPPGNPSNCQEITISEDALAAHMGHGDALVCTNADELAHYNDLHEKWHFQLVYKPLK